MLCLYLYELFLEFPQLLPSTPAITTPPRAGLLDYVLSDYLWARAVLLIGPTVVSALLYLLVLPFMPFPPNSRACLDILVFIGGPF